MKTILRKLLPTSIVGTLVLLLSISAFAQVDTRDDGPTAHDYNGTWEVLQKNGFVVTLVIRQNGKQIYGEASYNAGRKGIARGTITGRAWTIKDKSGWGCGCPIDQFHIEIAWHTGVGVYYGFTPWGDHYLQGETWPKGNPAGKVGWITKRNIFRLK